MEFIMEDKIQEAQIKASLEALIFLSNRPLTIEELKKVFTDVSASQIRDLALSLTKEYEENSRGLRIVEIAGGFQMATATSCAGHIKAFYKIKHTEKLSGPALETLAIIAYKQPVTRIDIETIRGVNVDGVVRSLLEKNLIRIVGRKEVIGRPFVYGTTRFFLDYFGLKSLTELPKIEEFAQQDMLLDINLASGEGEITPLSQEDQEQIQQESVKKSQQGHPQESQEETRAPEEANKEVS